MENSTERKPPLLAFDQPFTLGQTLYILIVGEGIREIPTSEETHELDYWEYRAIGEWAIARKGSAMFNGTGRYATSPLDAVRLKCRDSEEIMREAVDSCQEEISVYMEYLDEFYRTRDEERIS